MNALRGGASSGSRSAARSPATPAVTALHGAVGHVEEEAREDAEGEDQQQQRRPGQVLGDVHVVDVGVARTPSLGVPKAVRWNIHSR